MAIGRNPVKKHVFYLHGGIVQAQGENAVSDLFGPYKYKDILQELCDQGYNVISEVRPKDTREIEYAQLVSKQIDSLQSIRVPMSHIVVVGASLGAYIAMELAIQRKRC